MELRQNKRYRLDAFVSFSWEGTDGAVGRSEGHTRDISATGVFVVTRQLVPVGSLVRMELTLPPLQENGYGVRLRTQGHVLRTEFEGFAVIADMGFRMQFHDNEYANHRSNSTDTKRNEDKNELVLRLQLQN
jgi:hypothetical protein